MCSTEPELEVRRASQRLKLALGLMVLLGWMEQVSAAGMSVKAGVLVVVLSHTFCVMQTMKPFSSILYDSTVLSSCRILPAVVSSKVTVVS